jgi:hypothetical protein
MRHVLGRLAGSSTSCGHMYVTQLSPDLSMSSRIHHPRYWRGPMAGGIYFRSPSVLPYRPSYPLPKKPPFFRSPISVRYAPYIVSPVNVCLGRCGSVFERASKADSFRPTVPDQHSWSTMEYVHFNWWYVLRLFRYHTAGNENQNLLSDLVSSNMKLAGLNVNILDYNFTRFDRPSLYYCL